MHRQVSNYPRHKVAWQLISPPSAKVLKIIRHISLNEAQTLIDSGKAEPVYDLSDEIVGFRLKDRPTVAMRVLSRPVGLRPTGSANGIDGSDESCKVLSKAETEAAAGLLGESRTAKLSSAQKEVRALRFLRGSEDFVELAQKKLEAFTPRRVEEKKVAIVPRHLRRRA